MPDESWINEAIELIRDMYDDLFIMEGLCDTLIEELYGEFDPESLSYKYYVRIRELGIEVYDEEDNL